MGSGTAGGGGGGGERDGREDREEGVWVEGEGRGRAAERDGWGGSFYQKMRRGVPGKGGKQKISFLVCFTF